ncbi:hypothetical protein BDR04DRAFT_1122953 [Suillus decipiens]|nr:hypothetical protein BDR04DRAFT_1122953 [Suillus decipiens]
MVPSSSRCGYAFHASIAPVAGLSNLKCRSESNDDDDNSVPCKCNRPADITEQTFILQNEALILQSQTFILQSQTFILQRETLILCSTNQTHIWTNHSCQLILCSEVSQNASVSTFNTLRTTVFILLHLSQSQAQRFKSLQASQTEIFSTNTGSGGISSVSPELLFVVRFGLLLQVGRHPFDYNTDAGTALAVNTAGGGSSLSIPKNLTYKKILGMSLSSCLVLAHHMQQPCVGGCNQCMRWIAHHQAKIAGGRRSVRVDQTAKPLINPRIRKHGSPVTGKNSKGRMTRCKGCNRYLRVKPEAELAGSLLSVAKRKRDLYLNLTAHSTSIRVVNYLQAVLKHILDFSEAPKPRHS